MSRWTNVRPHPVTLIGPWRVTIFGHRPAFTGWRPPPPNVKWISL